MFWPGRSLVPTDPIGDPRALSRRQICHCDRSDICTGIAAGCDVSERQACRSLSLRGVENVPGRVASPAAIDRQSSRSSLRGFAQKWPSLAALLACGLTVALLGAAAQAAAAEGFRRSGADFTTMRTVAVPAASTATIAVVEFFHHGQISPDGKNVAVYTRREVMVPMRVLQLGPGDYCRLAFQLVKGQDEYEICYGGQPPTEKVPELVHREGLLLETRQFKQCDLNSLESVRKAFESAQPIGADFVDAVRHAGNPFSLGNEPFLSRYSGFLYIDRPGTYGFMTSSQDCSFLLIDGKVVIAAPGHHGPARHARPGSRGDIKLSPGAYKFEYYHAAAGSEAMMVAAWEVDPPEQQPRPAAIPPEVFRTGAVIRLPASPPSTRTVKVLPDFLMKIAGDVPLPDNPVPLLGVSFRDASPKTLSSGSRVQWDFGDGQTAEQLNVDHVYLRPGLYTVTLSFRRGVGKPVEITNRIYVDRPKLTARDKDKFHKLDDYLPLLETYDASKLDAVSLRQLVLAFEAKASELEAKAEAEAKAKTTEPESKPSVPRAPGAARLPEEDKNLLEATRYYRKAVEAGKTAFVGQSAARGDDDLFKLAQLVGAMARNRLLDSKTALEIWRGASERIAVGELKAQCAAEAADIAINDLLDLPLAKKLLEEADKLLAGRKNPAASGELQRVWGDYYAATGDGKAARKAYQQAEEILATRQRFIERTAWLGAHSRSTEEFLRQRQLDRAAAEIRTWVRRFPTEKLEGYATLLYAKFWEAQQLYPQAIAQAEQLIAAAPDSPYADQILLLAAECELKRGRTDRALATLRSLVKDYPGSPLVGQAKSMIARLEAGKLPSTPPKRP